MCYQSQEVYTKNTSFENLPHFQILSKISVFKIMVSNVSKLFISLNAVHPDVFFFNSQGIWIIQSSTTILLLNTLIYKATCFSSAQPSSGLYQEQINIWLCYTIGIPRVYNAEVYCLRCMVNLKLLELKWISAYCNKLK